ncbi:MAG: type 2 isopentenyl-diphosphate Delta-isomerase [Phototrophicaceae bacterium]
MTEHSQEPTTESRKVDHIKINLEKNVRFPNLTTGLERYFLPHRALPEIDMASIDLSTRFLGKELQAPILISSMTGGTQMAETINANLAIAAQEHGIAMGLGSQRAAIESLSLAQSFKLRQYAPDILLFANVGVIQLNYGFKAEHFQRAVDMAEADALILHFNVLQEAVQPEGDVNWYELLPKIEKLCHDLNVPIIAKEVGWGFDSKTLGLLAGVGITAVDVAGAGGTSWSEVEYHRAPNAFHAKVAAAFADWGYPTAEAIQIAKTVAPNLPIIASGGLKNGVDIAKTIALGAEIGGMAATFLRSAIESAEAVSEIIAITKKQLQVAMLCSGNKTIHDLKGCQLIQR